MSDGIADPDADFADNRIHRHWRQRWIHSRQELKNLKTELSLRHCRTVAEVKVYLSRPNINMEIA